MNIKIAHPVSEPHFAERGPADTLFGYKWLQDITKSSVRHVADLMLETLADATPALVSSKEIPGR
jgi:hypothetical protein